MAGGIVVGGLVAVALVVLLWRRRGAIGRWLISRDRGAKLAMLGAVGAILLLMVGTGVKGYDYMMHDNDFCSGCHIFVPSGQVFVRPDTGTYLLVNKVEGKHDSLSCHSCHPFELKAQSKELFYWIIQRPDRIPPHAKVPRRVCEGCHVQGEARKTWARIASTAGHRTHLESDSSALKNVACLTCHARTAHRFQPADTTCAQQGCHLTDDVRIRLGRMAARFTPANVRPLPNEEQLYCNACHQFTAEAQFVSRDSATGLLTPGSRQCFGCHEMGRLLASFDPAKDPHRGSCGMCHNPHTDVKPKDALKSCADAGCHGDWKTVPFHVGAAHRKAAPRCETCHVPHAARVDASDCAGCHESVRKSGGTLRPPLPFDTTRALRQSLRLVEPGRSRGRGGGPPDELPAPLSARPATPTDTFSHERHRRLACITCHTTTSPTRRLTFEPPRGCQICHHQRPASSACTTCHQASELSTPEPATVEVTVRGQAPRSRQVRFDHEKHDSVACVTCHTSRVTLEPEPPVRTCTACHENHHAAGLDCAGCHRTAEIMRAHAPPVEAHVACDQCHAERTIARLEPSRSFCLACHGAGADHHPERECTLCHLQASP
ncbi:MAG TPA: cytochrome c3 family protein, partial [Myxococcota bacterium]|nr:cytochrome c3 family protein [Myxococcota bacterium]